MIIGLKRNNHQQTQKTSEQANKRTSEQTNKQTNKQTSHETTMTATMTAQIKTEFNALVSDDQDYTLVEMKKMLGEVFKTIKENNKTQKEVKKPKKEIKNDDVSSDDDTPAKKRGRPLKVKLDKNGNPKEKKAPSAYNIFIKEHSAAMKKLHPDAKAPEIMKLVAALWKEEKEKNAQKTDENDD